MVGLGGVFHMLAAVFALRGATGDGRDAEQHPGKRAQRSSGISGQPNRLTNRPNNRTASSPPPAIPSPQEDAATNTMDSLWGSGASSSAAPSSTAKLPSTAKPSPTAATPTAPVEKESLATRLRREHKEEAMLFPTKPNPDNFFPASICHGFDIKAEPAAAADPDTMLAGQRRSSSSGSSSGTSSSIS
jgi:hypothetical protein